MKINKFEIAMAVVVASALTTFAYIQKQKEFEWEQFKSEYHCKAVSVADGEQVPDLSPDITDDELRTIRDFTTNSLQRTRYECDHGIVVYR